jgi:putative sterol carrier protein
MAEAMPAGQAEGQVLEQGLAREVEQALETFRQKIMDPRVVKDYKSWSGKVMQYHFTDTGRYYHIRFQDGLPQPAAAGKPERADVSYEMSSAIFLAMSRKEISGLKAYALGKVKVRASMPDLLKLQKLDSL